MLNEGRVLRAKTISSLFIFGQAGKNRPYHPNTPNPFSYSLCDAAGLPRYRVHDLRHTYALWR